MTNSRGYNTHTPKNGNQSYSKQGYKGNQNKSNNNLNDLEEIERKIPIDDSFKNNYVDNAMNVMKELSKDNKDRRTKMITKTKIRSIYNMLCDIIANESESTEATLSPESITALKMFRVRVIYDAGRDEKDLSVKNFVKASKILGYLNDIGDSKEKFELYCKYFESLIAYHRFLYTGTD